MSAGNRAEKAPDAHGRGGRSKYRWVLPVAIAVAVAVIVYVVIVSVGSGTFV